MGKSKSYGKSRNRRFNSLAPQNLENLMESNYLHNSPYIFREFLRRKQTKIDRALDVKILEQETKLAREYFYGLLQVIGLPPDAEEEFLETMRKSNKIEDNVLLVEDSFKKMIKKLTTAGNLELDKNKEDIIQKSIEEGIYNAVMKGRRNSKVMNIYNDEIFVGKTFNLDKNQLDYKNKRSRISNAREIMMEEILSALEKNQPKLKINKTVFKAMFYGVERSEPLFQIAANYYQMRMNMPKSEIPKFTETERFLKKEEWEEYKKSLATLSDVDKEGTLSAMVGKISEDLAIQRLRSTYIPQIKDLVSKNNKSIGIYVPHNSTLAKQASSKVAIGDRNVTVKADIYLPAYDKQIAGLGLSLKTFHPHFNSEYQSIKIDETTDAQNIIATLRRHDIKEAKYLGYMIANYSAFINGMQPVNTKKNQTYKISNKNVDYSDLKKQIDRFLRVHAMYLMGGELIGKSSGSKQSSKDYMMTVSIIHDPSSGVTIPVYKVLEELQTAVKKTGPANIDFSMGLKGGKKFDAESSLELHNKKLAAINPKRDSYRRNGKYTYPRTLVTVGSTEGKSVLQSIQINSYLNFKTSFLSKLRNSK